MRRPGAVLVALGLALVALAGCGDDGDAPPDPAPTVEPTAPPGTDDLPATDPEDADLPTDDGPTTSVATTVAPPRDPGDPGYPEIEPRPGVTYPASAPD